MKKTARRAAFVQEYLIDLNATQAAIRAGYSPRTANTQGAQLLANVSVRSAIAEAMQAREERTQITQDRVLQELARLSFGDLRKAYKEDGELKLPHEWDDDTAAMMSGVDVVTTSVGGGKDEAPVSLTTKKVKVFDKSAALTLCMRHLGMLNDKMQVTAAVEGTVRYMANIPRRG